MAKFHPFRALYSVNNFTAAMLALAIGFSLGLPRPYWAMLTVYIIAQPMAGALRSKAIYRLAGTILGAVAAVVLVPALAAAPVLLSITMALWVGGCLAISFLDRTPRSYVVMLAGYTAAIIGFPSVGQPDAIFYVAVARVEEISLGIICATIVHSLIFPRPVRATLVAQMRARKQAHALYAAGRTPFINSLDAQRALASAEITLAASSAQLAADQVSLFLALGEGWEKTEP
jgi:uncharacterized membrane protein YccC